MADIFFLNQIPFFLMLSRNISFPEVNHLADRNAETIFMAFEQIYQFSINRGFRATIVHAAGEFAPLQAMTQAMPGGPRVNLASSSKDVPEIKRRITVVMERSSSTRHRLPFNRIPKLLTIHIVFHAVKKGGINFLRNAAFRIQSVQKPLCQVMLFIKRNI